MFNNLIEAAFDHHSQALVQAIENKDEKMMQKEYIATEIAANQFLIIAEKEKEYSDDIGYKTELEAKICVIQAGILD